MKQQPNEKENEENAQFDKLSRRQVRAGSAQALTCIECLLYRMLNQWFISYHPHYR